MTLQEKAALLGGKGEWETRDIPRLGIPSMVCSDGPSGLRRQAGTGDHLGLNPSLPATCFPCPSLMACKVLGAGSDSLALYSADKGSRHFSGKIGILGKIFKIPAAERISLDI